MTEKEIHQIVYDAGYTPRETSYELVGEIVKSGGGYTFRLRDTGQEFPFKPDRKFDGRAEKAAGKTIRIKTGTETVKKTMYLEPLKFEIIDNKTQQ